MEAKLDFDSKLIDLVRANPLLYEKEVRSSPYHLMKKKSELWRSIASSLGVETKYCIIRWKNLRDKYRRESQKTQELKRKAGGIESAQGATWHLLDKMKFLDHHTRVHSSTSTKSAAENVRTSWREMEAEQLIEQLSNDDDPLQEAMDEQAVALEAKKPGPVVSTTTTTASCLKRIETLLSGLDEDNRTKAEKRIVAYLYMNHLDAWFPPFNCKNGFVGVGKFYCRYRLDATKISYMYICIYICRYNTNILLYVCTYLAV